ncbi:non-heme iron oxygenase ferredoxin subunit [Candidatus Gottesmanbacteria bacterium]|nr:non-heme iron oxygenase ferredoxin subunit [Candidatus Gottesmanbacteria bacterium]MBI3443710.1 non-heme iron oxygenase ferredoxin subunit [Candidatus Woesebacteria bacterium]
MSDLVKVAKISDIPEGSMKTFEVNGKRIAIANVDGDFFAIDDTCTHEQCSLGGEGVLDGTTVVCGCHGASFDVTSGKVLSLPAPTDVASYEVKVEGEDIMVRIQL